MIGKECPICGKLVQKNIRVHIFKHSEVSTERRIKMIDALVNQSNKKNKRVIKHIKIIPKSKNNKCKSIYWGSVLKTAFESNRRKY